MIYLACMRMICDTPAILDPTCRVSPKLEELERVLSDLLEEPDRKVIVFSEWERMLEMVRELAGEMGLEVAWHTGSVPQQRRRAEIQRFKQESPLPAVPVDGQRQRRIEPASCERGGERRPAVEPGETGATHRAGLAQRPGARRDGRQSRDRRLDRARHGASARRQTGARGRRARRSRGPRSAEDAVGSRRPDRADASLDAGQRGGGSGGAADRTSGGGPRRGSEAAPWRVRHADTGAPGAPMAVPGSWQCSTSIATRWRPRRSD